MPFSGEEAGFAYCSKEIVRQVPTTALFDWEKVYTLSFRSTLESKLKEFKHMFTKF